MGKKSLLFVLGIFAFTSNIRADTPSSQDLNSAQLMPIEKVEQLEWNMPVYTFSTLDPNGPRKFTGHYLGVLNSTPWPDHAWIVINLEGEFFQNGSVIAGQSGSPVFVDLEGKPYKIGTISYGTEGNYNAIAFLTPIAEVLSVSNGDMASPGVQLSTVRQSLSEFESTKHSEMLDTVSSGMIAHGTPEPLTAGSVLGVQLMWGDFDITSFGTVSHIQDKRIYMFGHPFLQLGKVEYRLVRARVITVDKSYGHSTILAVPLGGIPPVGMITEDRATGISGVLGQEPTSAISVTIDTSAGHKKRTFHLSLISHPDLTPRLVSNSIDIITEPLLRTQTNTTMFVTGRVEYTDGTGVNFTGTSFDQLALRSLISTRIHSAMSSKLVELHVQKINLNIRIYEDSRVLIVRLASSDKPYVLPGGTVDVRFSMSRTLQEPVAFTVPIVIPKNVSGTAKIVISGQGIADSALKEPITPVETGALQKSGPWEQSAAYVYVFLNSKHSKTVIQSKIQLEDFLVLGKRELNVKIGPPSKPPKLPKHFWKKL